jgi:hypothetical protein
VGGSYQFAVDVVRTVCDRLAAMAADLRLLAEAGESYRDWLAWEAYLACRLRQADDSFCEVAARPTYASEGVADGPGDDRGDLRVGGPDGGADHCWLFAEFVLVHDGNRAGGEWRREAEAAAARLERLGWKKSAALVVVAGAIPGAEWDRPALTDPCVIPLAGGGTFVVTAFDIKRDPADTLTPATG